MKLKINVKCSDRCSISLLDDNEEVAESHSYVPRDIGIGGGDYISLTIDTETGQVEGWVPLDKQDTIEQIENV